MPHDDDGQRQARYRQPWVTVDATPALEPDRPIADPAKDLFGRTEFARTIAQYIAGSPKGQSLVFALNGPWGHGKTSVLNLLEPELKTRGIKVIWCNPWLFTRTEQIASTSCASSGSNWAARSLVSRKSAR